MSDAPDTVIRKVFGNTAIHQISGSRGSRKEQVVKNVHMSSFVQNIFSILAGLTQLDIYYNLLNKHCP